MAEETTLDPDVSVGYTNSTTVHEQISFVRNSETKWEVHALTSAKPATLKQVGKFKIPFWHNFYLWHSVM